MTTLTADKHSLGGQAVYTKAVLAIYDFWVHGISNHLIWRCPTRHLNALYDRHVTLNHLDAGVGTGYFLDRCSFPSSRPRLILVDANRNSLEVATRRLRRYRPKLYRRNVLKPLNIDGPPFDSIGLMYLLHCLPGDLVAKAVVFDNLNAFLSDAGVIFGATVLGSGVDPSRIARKLMRVYNAKGIFSNIDDHLGALRDLLEQRYAEVQVDAVGCVALFSARRLKRVSLTVV
jgi:Methyltransferase domain